MNVIKKELSDTSSDLEKTSILLSREAQTISIYLENIKSGATDIKLAISKIEDAVETLNALVNWVDECGAQVENIRRKIIEANSNP